MLAGCLLAALPLLRCCRGVGWGSSSVWVGSAGVDLGGGALTIFSVLIVAGAGHGCRLRSATCGCGGVTGVALPAGGSLAMWARTVPGWARRAGSFRSAQVHSG